MRRKVFFGLTVMLATILALQAWNTRRDVQNAPIIYMAMAPVDPRALMLGDYMTIRYAFEPGDWSRRGEVLPNKVLYVHENGVADEKGPGRAILMTGGPDRYRIAHQYFFKEGTGKKYERATYVALKELPHGKFSVAGLTGDDLIIIE